MNDQELYEIRQQRLARVEKRTNDILNGVTARGAHHPQRVRDVVQYVNIAYGEDDDLIHYSPLRSFMGLIDPSTVTRITIKPFTVIMTSDVETLYIRERHVTLVDEDQREWTMPEHIKLPNSDSALEHRLVRLHNNKAEGNEGFIYEYEKLTYLLDCIHDILEDEFGVHTHGWKPASPEQAEQRRVWTEFYTRVLGEYPRISGNEVYNLEVVIDGKRRTRHFI